MKTKYLILGMLLTSVFSMKGFAQEQAFGTVDFNSCVQESKLGKQEQESFESVKKQMTTVMSDVEKQLTEISEKLKDSDYMDTLSPEAEKELKSKFQTLSEQMNQYQGQYYQVMNQMNNKVLQNVASSVKQASQSVAQQHGLKCVLHKEVCFFASDALDVTKDIVSAMDARFDEEQKAKAKEAAESPKQQ